MTLAMPGDGRMREAMESSAATGNDIVAATANPSANATARAKSEHVVLLVIMMFASARRDSYRSWPAD
jgi:hypothetical protein